MEARLLLDLRPNLALGGIHDVRPTAEQARLGGVLAAEQLQEVRDTLAGSRNLRETIARLQDRLPLWWEKLQVLPDCGAVEQEITRCIGPRGEVLDDASPLLARLRAEVRQAHDRLTGRLNELLNTARVRTVLQEPIITLRGGRYVVPVKADFRGEFRGIVHDTSTSGATMFMEPLETVDLGNAWRQLQIEEEREVERVLRQLSLLVGDYTTEITQVVDILAHMDLALAKAKYGQQIKGIVPFIEPPPETSPAGESPDTARRKAVLKLANARHPLLTGHVVPTSLEVGRAFGALVITGPNTGGKTVALKTVGLLVLMNQAGMPVPAAEGTGLPLYADVFADIGDEQSIEQSLSTFSSHMSNIIRILRQARDDCLALLDELGAGTDPTEGSALGRAILLALLEAEVTTIATTHHSDLKVFAHSTPGVQNASVEFDTETLSPTYRLSIGLPGRSNAIAIAERLGLPEHLAERARQLLQPEGLQVENLLTQIQHERDAAARLRLEAEEERRQAAAAQQAWLAQLQQLEEEQERLRDEVRRQLDAEVEGLKQELRDASKEIQRALREQQRERLIEAAKTVEHTEAQLASPSWQPTRRRRAEGKRQPLRLVPGAQVWVRGLGQAAEIVATPAAPEEEVEVQIGAFRAKVKPDQLEALEGRPPAPAERPSPGWAVATPPAEAVEPELHLRGLRVEEALSRLEEYLDAAFRAGLPWVRVVHGKGTGVMRRAVRELLSQHPLVRSYDSAPQEGGGEGVTVAHLTS